MSPVDLEFPFNVLYWVGMFCIGYTLSDLWRML